MIRDNNKSVLTMEVDVNEDASKDKIENFDDKIETDEMISDKENAPKATDNFDSSKQKRKEIIEKSTTNKIISESKEETSVKKSKVQSLQDALKGSLKSSKLKVSSKSISFSSRDIEKSPSDVSLEISKKNVESKVPDSNSSRDSDSCDNQESQVGKQKVMNLKNALGHDAQKATGQVKDKEAKSMIADERSRIPNVVKPSNEGSMQSTKRPRAAKPASRNVKKPRVQPLFEALRVEEEVVTEDEREELEEEEDRQFELTFGKDPCEKCPGCKSLMVSTNTNISINVASCCYIINCMVCEARITIKNALSDRQRQFLHSNLKA